jgi:hypothetical protein
MDMIARKFWKLGDCEMDGDALVCQQIDHIWAGKPGTAAYMADCDHIAKITVCGTHCTAIAGRIIGMLNSEGERAAQPADDDDRAIILRAMKHMGSMATASLYHILALDYGDERFVEALTGASRPQLDELLAKCKNYL